MEIVIGLVVGIVGSLTASYLYKYIEHRRFMHRVDIEGVWAEIIPQSLGRRTSLGRIHYDERRKMFLFDGTNYNDTGEPFCHWDTVASYLDTEARRFYYIFVARLDGSLENTYSGFGVLNLAPQTPGSTVLVPFDGYYVSASVDGRPMSHSMQRVPNIEYRRGQSGTPVIDLLTG